METTEEKRNVCTIPEIVNGKAKNPGYHEAPKKYNFVAAGELLVTITLAAYRHLITNAESKRQESWKRMVTEDALNEAKDRIKALEAVMKKAGIDPDLCLKVSGRSKE